MLPEEDHKDDREKLVSLFYSEVCVPQNEVDYLKNPDVSRDQWEGVVEDGVNVAWAEA